MRQLIRVEGNVIVGTKMELYGNVILGAPMTVSGKILINIGSGVAHPTYEGPYEVVPKVYEQSLETDDLLMIDDVTVHEITYSSVTNEKGGLTVQIGEI